tara:strand:+ start:159 stop:317 length:159 start_codon:yes stop_codon:yes gene_type:complete
MPFGGGSSGSGAITAHLHNSLAGEGGNLSSTATNLDSRLLQNSIIINALVYG